MKKTIMTFVLGLLTTLALYAGDYKYVRTYDANGNIVETAANDQYISAEVRELSLLWERQLLLSWGVYAKIGDDWQWSPAPNYGYNGQNNGWLIFVCTIGYHTDYFYYKQDGSCVRTTFMAGGNGRYREYIPAKRPIIDRMQPTR